MDTVKQVDYVQSASVTGSPEKQANSDATRKTVSIWDLSLYGGRKQIILLRVAILLSAILGSGFPLTIMAFRLIVNEYLDEVAAVQSIYRTSLWFIFIAICVFVVAFIQTFITCYFSIRVAHRLRLMFFRAILRQDVTWFDQQLAANLSAQLFEDAENVQAAIGVKLAEFVQNIASFVVGLLIALVSGWKLTLVACSMLPFIIMGFLSFGGVMHYFNKKETDAYSKARVVAEEVLRAVRTVFAFGGEQREAERYTTHLKEAARVGVIQSTCFGIAAGFIGFSVYASAALVFWYGVRLLHNGECDAGSVVLVFLNVIIGSLFLGGALPNMRYFRVGQSSVERMFNVIQRNPPIDKDQKGIRPDSFFSSITFEDVTFSYASRRSRPVLDGMNLTILQNETVAFVGPSGCGKSTLMHLFQRFYDPDSGKITVDGIDIRELDLQWYRSQIAIVQQEPTLFTGTIFENIRMGCLDVTDEQIIEASKQANAHHFIVKFPDAYETRITQGGSALSVGQKQRIAIARALVRSPRILILDEATCALDTRSEHLVQAALNRACVGRTVLTVAHRLSTIRKANRIFVIDEGRICECGTHAELSSSNGLYTAMLKAQEHTSHVPDNFPIQYDLLEEASCELEGNGAVKRIVGDSDVFSQLLPASKSAGSLQSLHSKYENSNGTVAYRKPSGWIRVLRLNRPELAFIILGAIAAAVTGGIQPVFAVLYSEVYAVFTMRGDPSGMQSKINLITAIMASLGFCRFLSSTFQAYLFGVSGQRLTRRLRKLLFAAILRQDMDWFDDPENHVGALNMMLTTDTNSVHPLFGVAMGRVVESVVLVFLSLAVAFFYNWKLTLVVVIFFPIITLSSFFHVRQMRNDSDTASETVAARVAYDALAAVRTVTSFGLENHFYRLYSSCLEGEMRSVNRKSLRFAVVYALAQSLPICAYAAAFSFGAYLIDHQEIQLTAVFRVFAAISFAAQAMGRTSHLGPDMKKASSSAERIFRILDRKSRIPVFDGLRPEFNLNSVPIHFKRVSFAYVSRPTVPVIQNFSHTIFPGQKIAIVGHSGCGKSSIFKLLLRLYDCGLRGTDRGLFIDTIKLDRIAPVWIRQQIGLVDQEPHLFNRTIRDNIAYGCNSSDVKLDDIVEAACRVHIHEFITTLPKGYDTFVGPHGCELSVGQKQRLAIARMLVRRPNLLLLDEATSALDPQTARQVQTSLDELSDGKTVILSAHHLCALEKADLAVVLTDGVKVEVGKHNELMRLQGAYRALFHSQLTHS